MLAGPAAAGSGVRFDDGDGDRGVRRKVPLIVPGGASGMAAALLAGRPRSLPAGTKIEVVATPGDPDSGPLGPPVKNPLQIALDSSRNSESARIRFRRTNGQFVQHPAL